MEDVNNQTKSRHQDETGQPRVYMKRQAQEEVNINSDNKMKQKKKEEVVKECHICNKKVQQLRAHIRRNHEKVLKTSEYAGRCPVCGKHLMDDYKVKRHIQQVHENKRDFMCNLCDKAFYERKDLHRHISGVHLVSPQSRRHQRRRLNADIIRRRITGGLSVDENTVHNRFKDNDSTLGGGTYGPTGIYFTAESKIQQIQTKPPEVLVAGDVEGEEEEDGESDAEHVVGNVEIMEDLDVADDEPQVERELEIDKVTDDSLGKEQVYKIIDVADKEANKVVKELVISDKILVHKTERDQDLGLNLSNRILNDSAAILINPESSFTSTKDVLVASVEFGLTETDQVLHTSSAPALDSSQLSLEPHSAAETNLETSRLVLEAADFDLQDEEPQQVMLALAEPVSSSLTSSSTLTASSSMTSSSTLIASTQQFLVNSGIESSESTYLLDSQLVFESTEQADTNNATLSNSINANDITSQNVDSDERKAISEETNNKTIKLILLGSSKPASNVSYISQAKDENLPDSDELEVDETVTIVFDEDDEDDEEDDELHDDTDDTHDKQFIADDYEENVESSKIEPVPVPVISNLCQSGEEKRKYFEEDDNDEQSLGEESDEMEEIEIQLDDLSDSDFKITTSQNIPGDDKKELKDEDNNCEVKMIKIRWGVPCHQYLEQDLSHQYQTDLGSSTQSSNTCSGIARGPTSSHEQRKYDENLLQHGTSGSATGPDNQIHKTEVSHKDALPTYSHNKNELRELPVNAGQESGKTIQKSNKNNVKLRRAVKGENSGIKCIPEPVQDDVSNLLKCPEQGCNVVSQIKNWTKYRKHYERVHLKLRPYSCKHCNFRFYDKADLKRHFESVHSKIKIICPVEGCNTLTSRIDLHITKIHPATSGDNGTKTGSDLEKTKPACEICGQTFNRSYDVIRHKKTVHFGDKSFKCEDCQRMFSDRRDLERHRSAVHLGIQKQVKRFVCQHCKESFKRKKDLVQHLINNPHINQPHQK